MHAMVLRRARSALEWTELPDPLPAAGEVRLRVTACGVCRTDLHVIDGELAHPRLPLVPGHQIVGRIDALGAGCGELRIGQRVGVPWLGHTCGSCVFCASGQENLCDHPVFTGYTRDGGFATAAIADARYTFALGEDGEDAEVAPLLCAGLIGWRALRLAGAGERIGLYGFGAAAHILTQVARWQGRVVFAFTQPGDLRTQAFARELGAHWAGDSTELPPEPLDAALLFAPVGALVPLALQAVRKGGRVVCAGIHMSDIPSFAYQLLWEERQLLSVANLTRQDGLEFFAQVARIGVRTRVTTYALRQANEALADLRAGRFEGAAVLVP
ncbi:MAG TPA: zinc-dependent alcohol dehydrogenase family protein [Steroidobacteraceae bacterium]|nr:zinc-dependent alcohol dehydrogenase family protein [Steroidobacteraceae bacterium]